VRKNGENIIGYLHVGLRGGNVQQGGKRSPFPNGNSDGRTAVTESQGGLPLGSLEKILHSEEKIPDTKGGENLSPERLEELLTRKRQ